MLCCCEEIFGETFKFARITTTTLLMIERIVSFKTILLLMPCTDSEKNVALKRAYILKYAVKLKNYEIHLFVVLLRGKQVSIKLLTPFVGN